MQRALHVLLFPMLGVKNRNNIETGYLFLNQLNCLIYGFKTSGYHFSKREVPIIIFMEY